MEISNIIVVCGYTLKLDMTTHGYVVIPLIMRLYQKQHRKHVNSVAYLIILCTKKVVMFV